MCQILSLLVFVHVSLNSISSIQCSQEMSSAVHITQSLKHFNISAYMGRWYQTHTSLIPHHTFERDAFCVVADYLALPLTTTTNKEDETVGFRLINSLNKGNPTGLTVQAQGTAVATHVKTQPHQFILQYDSRPFINAFYWIVALGPITQSSGLYSWAVVSNPLNTLLFILARNVTEFEEKYETDVLMLVAQMGFTQATDRPLRTYQSPLACKYPALPTSSLGSAELTNEKHQNIVTPAVANWQLRGGHQRNIDREQHVDVTIRFAVSNAKQKENILTEIPPRYTGIVCIKHRDGTESCRDTTDTPT